MAAPTETGDSNHLRFNEPKFDGDSADTGRKQSGADHKGSIYAKPDLENGEEYSNLVAYISSYYEGPRRKSVVSMEEQDAARGKKPWWKFWAKKSKGEGGEEGFEVPDDVSFRCSSQSLLQWHAHTDATQPQWLEADISQGISNSEVEQRRKRTGWNELVSLHDASIASSTVAWLISEFLDHRKGKSLHQGRPRSTLSALFPTLCLLAPGSQDEADLSPSWDSF